MARLPLSTQAPMPTRRQMQAQASTTSDSLSGAMDMFFKVATVGNEIAKTGAIIRQVQHAESELAWKRESLPLTMEHDRAIQESRHSIAELESQSRVASARIQKEAVAIDAQSRFLTAQMVQLTEVRKIEQQAEEFRDLQAARELQREQHAANAEYLTFRLQSSAPMIPQTEGSKGAPLMALFSMTNPAEAWPGLVRYANNMHGVSGKYGQTTAFMHDAVQLQTALSTATVPIEVEGGVRQISLHQVAAVLQRGTDKDKEQVRSSLLNMGYADEDIEELSKFRAFSSPALFSGQHDHNAWRQAMKLWNDDLKLMREAVPSSDEESFNVAATASWARIATAHNLDPATPPFPVTPHVGLLSRPATAPGQGDSGAGLLPSRFVGGLVPPDRDQFGDIFGEGAPGVAQPTPAARSGESVVDEGEGSLSLVSRQTEPRDRVVTKYGGGILGRTRPVGEGDLVLPDAIDRYLVYMQSNEMRWLNHGALIEMLKERAPKTRTRGGLVAYRVSPELYDEVRQAVRDAEEASRAAQRRRPSRS